jgi:large subunit ribosomal protein L22
MPESRATLRYLRTSPPKVRQVLGLIRGLDVDDARETLTYCERGSADEVRKLLDSAIANAEHNENVPADELFVERAYVDEGPTLKRWRPRARGRGTRIRKRTSHLTIVVSRFDDEELERRREREVVEGPSRRRPTRRRAARPEPDDHDHDDHDHDDHEHDDEALGEAAPDDEAGEPVETEAGESVTKTPAKKTPAKKTRAKKTPAKKTTAKKAPAKKAPAKKTTRKKDS